MIYITVGSYLDGLDRTFSVVDNKIVDLYVTMPEKEVSNLIDIAQVSQQQVSNHGARKLDDFEYEEAVIVAKYNGYFNISYLILLLIFLLIYYYYYYYNLFIYLLLFNYIFK